MHIDAHPRPDTGAAAAPSGDEARKRTITHRHRVRPFRYHPQPMPPA
ncbi:MAG: hypothetical protein OXI15_06730 [Chromatiales bacterium]|nr:hypothetical protein [Chromatiales bacterium]